MVAARASGNDDRWAGNGGGRGPPHGGGPRGGRGGPPGPPGPRGGGGGGGGPGGAPPLEGPDDRGSASRATRDRGRSTRAVIRRSGPILYDRRGARRGGAAGRESPDRRRARSRSPPAPPARRDARTCAR